MKITDVKTFPICHGNSRNYLFVKVETDDGLYGVGEFGITWKEQAGIGAIEHMKRHIIGLDPLNTEYIWQLLFRVDFFPGGRINAAAMSAIGHCTVGHQGQGAGATRVHAIGRQDARARFLLHRHWRQDAR